MRELRVLWKGFIITLQTRLEYRVDFVLGLLGSIGLNSGYQPDEAGWIAFIYRNMLDFEVRDGAGSVGGLGVDGRDSIPVYRDGRRCSARLQLDVDPVGLLGNQLQLIENLSLEAVLLRR